MPASYKMSWEPRARRWWKQYKGMRYTISCRQLNALETKEGSYLVANSWWVAKKAEIDGQKPNHAFKYYVSDLERRRAWALKHGQPDVASFIGSEMAHVEQGGLPAFMPSDELPNFDDAPPPDGCGYTDDIPFEVLVNSFELSELNRSIDPQDHVWNDRVARENDKPVPEERTIGGLVKVWLSLKQARVESGDLSPKGYDNTVDCLNYFRDWVGSGADVTVLDAKRWQDYWLHLSNKIKNKLWSREYATKMFRVARNFVGWSGKLDLIQVPKNLHDRELSFGRGPKAVPTMTVDEVRMLVEAATGQLRLHLLLMANCGMTQKDISDLRQTEVDWQTGRIIRKRSKTGDHETVPTVDYKLWPVTWVLLQEYRAIDSQSALLTLSGRLWVDSKLVQGKLISTDSIASNYTHLKRKLSFKLPLKLLRKTSASLLGSRPEFGSQIVGRFLGHAPRTIQEKHYVSPSQERFDEAVDWLGRKYGFLDE